MAVVCAACVVVVVVDAAESDVLAAVVPVDELEAPSELPVLVSCLLIRRSN